MIICTSKSLRVPVRLRISLSFLLFIFVIRECAMAYCRLNDEDFAIAGILRVEEAERVERDGGWPVT